jgi:hypothetical protein
MVLIYYTFLSLLTFLEKLLLHPFTSCLCSPFLLSRARSCVANPRHQEEQGVAAPGMSSARLSAVLVWGISEKGAVITCLVRL